MSRLFTAFTALALAIYALPASSEVVLSRFALPSNGSPVDIAPLVADLEGPVRIVLSGTLSSSLTSSEIDALALIGGGRRDESSGPFVRLPPGARLIESDPDISSYIFEVPTDGPLPLALHLAPLAARRLVTSSEMEASCTGAIEVEVVGPHPVPVSGAVAAKDTVSRTIVPSPPLLIGSSAAVLLLMSIGGVLFRRRGRRPSTARLIRRCRAADREVRKEASGLGPAFGYVSSASAELLEAALKSRDHLTTLRSAKKRTARLEARDAVMERERLARRQQTTMDHLEGITERLEATAAELTARRAEQTRVMNVEELVTELTGELETAVAATEEARVSQTSR